MQNSKEKRHKVLSLRKGICSHCFPYEWSFNQIFKAAVGAGYEGVEIRLDVDRYHPMVIPKKKRRAVREDAESLGLGLPSLSGAGINWAYNITGSDASVRRKGIELVKKGIEFASDVDAKIFLVVPGKATPNVSYERMYKLSKRAILQVARTAEEFGVRIGVENVWNMFLYSPLEFRNFIEEIDHEYVKVYFDVGNVSFLGFPQHWIEMLGDLIICVHVKDFAFQMQDFESATLKFKSLLQGEINWKAAMHALRKIRYQYFLNVEVPPNPADPLKPALINRSALDQILSIET